MEVALNMTQVTADCNVFCIQKYEYKAWNNYVLTHKNATPFHQAQFCTFIEEIYGHKAYLLAAYDSDRQICGILPLNYVSSILFGKALISGAFFVYGGILADNDIIAMQLAQEAQNIAQKLNVDYIELRHKDSLCLDEGFGDWLLKDTTYAHFLTEIPVEEDKNLNLIPRKKRADLRKAIQNTEIAYSFDKNIDDFYKCYADSLHKLGTPVHSKKYYAKLCEMLQDDCEILTIYHLGKPVSSLMSFYYKNTVFPYFGGAIADARKLHAYDYMYWLMMRRAIEKKHHFFDFGRSKFGTGAFDYKKNWGFEPKNLQYQYYLVQAKQIPDINPNNPSYARKVKLWQFLPQILCNMVGPYISNKIG